MLLKMQYHLSIATKFLLLFLFSTNLNCSNTQSWIEAGYHYTGIEFPVSDIDSTLFTHLICGFAHINSSTYQLSFNSSTQQEFSTFTNVVKRKNPEVTALLSIWGGGGDYSVLFSLLNQSSHRRSFIESSITTARLYEFDGLDLKGAVPRTSMHTRSLGTFLNEWRAAVDSEAKKSGKSGLLLTMALYHHMQVMDTMTYPIDSIKKNLNWVHLVAYDYYLPKEEKFTHPHAALYDPISNGTNTNSRVKDLISRGLPASKLVLGLPYHGYGWTLVNTNDYNVGAAASGPAVTIDGSMAYKYIKWFIKTYGYGAVPMYNDTYVVNYCTIGSSWIDFDDVEAISAKVSYAKKMGLLGYSVFQVGNDDNWVLSRAAAQKEGGQQNKKRLVVIVLVTIAMIILLGTMMCYLQRRVLKSIGIIDNIKRSVYRLLNIVPGTDSLDGNAPNLQVFSYATIKAATNNFSSQNKLGEGGFGPVYKGTLRKGQQIAVKRLSKTSNQGLEEFQNEVTLTATLHHVNLVRVLGYCTKREEKMLVYEYMPNKSLDHYLFDPSSSNLLDWKQRVHIIEGVIQGLLYLQEYSNSTIIHRDLKASNILLDDEMKPKISDFGLARAFRKNEHEANTGRIVGTYGYVPPEYVRRGIYSMKYDVYSFGVLLLQIISGKRSSCFYGLDGNLNILEHAYELWREGQGMDFIDPTLDDSTSSCKLLRCMVVALLCVQENPVDRPSMLEVCSMLKSEIAAIISPKKPAFSVKKDEDEDHIYKFREEINSVNDATMSEIVPR
ncbi:cysteine-rich receptor-like protein kinase 7 isoform X1 [Rosa chinensis]|uniref:cysteine-rich receptor-like protein kinase 7 isoform X1 n=1 Tax=Rosa chinensis TaxID=74649 RepID=UPI000D08BBF9|nr:cysteine-rich receptor-like protein kinase 7 isoform X1 [Rosa chinensis]XP_024182842.1 cysteine-rich receptor-like protein kinase 7 isoform X1 [Rosa chinensis]